MSKKIEDLILRTLIIIPGIVGIASIDFDKSNRPLKEEKFTSGILIEEELGGIVVSIAIIIEYNVNANVVSREINCTVGNILMKENIKLINLKIYIRGVQ